MFDEPHHYVKLQQTGYQGTSHEVVAELKILHCPACGKQHIDTVERTGTGLIDWSRRPHKTHLCKNTPEGPKTGCGHKWQPKEIYTVGVAILPTE